MLSLILDLQTYSTLDNCCTSRIYILDKRISPATRGSIQLRMQEHYGGGRHIVCLPVKLTGISRITTLMIFPIPGKSQRWSCSTTVMGRTVDVWYGWVPILARHYRVLRMDYRGHGRSAPPRPGYPWSLATLAREAKLLLDRLAVKRVHWAGESLGGHVGIQFANDYPDRIASLTLCSTPVSLYQ